MTSSQKLSKNACHEHLSKHCCLFLFRTGFETQVMNKATLLVQAVCAFTFHNTAKNAKIFSPARKDSQSKSTTITRP